ncbi:MAG: hypothetical protein ABJA98_23755, partial [Acidobacteriota bacterium]
RHLHTPGMRAPRALPGGRRDAQNCTRYSSTGPYHPQQSVLNPHSVQRQTACMRYISAPQRSHSILSSAGEVLMIELRRGGGGGDGVSAIRRHYRMRQWLKPPEIMSA